jgi:hypothetical protein
MQVLKNRVGEKIPTLKNGLVEVIAYTNNRNCNVKLEDGTIIKSVEYKNIRRVKFKNPNSLSVCGIGYVGSGKYSSKDNNIAYKKWISMLNRCYNKVVQLKQITYKDVTVCKEWHNFQNFAEWFYKNYIDGWCLDKDILVKGNKVYSPETCCFVPQEINNLFTLRENKRGDYPIGVALKGKKFKAVLNVQKIPTVLGVFKTPEEAFEKYKIAKESYIKEVADKWRNKIEDRVYQALYNFKVEITD